jgi:hypothetical protein
MRRADVVYLCLNLAGWALFWALFDVSGAWRGILGVLLFLWSVAMVIQRIREQQARDQPAAMHLDSK